MKFVVIPLIRSAEPKICYITQAVFQNWSFMLQQKSALPIKKKVEVHTPSVDLLAAVVFMTLGLPS